MIKFRAFCKSTKLAARNPHVIRFSVIEIAAVGALIVFEPRFAYAAGAPVAVSTATARTRDVAIVREGLGTVNALNTATIHVQVSGLLDRVDFTEGQTLKKGQEIAQIDQRPFQAVLDQAIATRARDLAMLKNSQFNLNRTQPLATKGYATGQLLDNQTAAVDQAQSTIQIDDATIDAARTQLSFTTITAPFDGVAGIRLIDAGNVVHPTDPSGLVVVTQVQPISVLFALPSADIPDVQAALKKGDVTAIAYASDDKTERDKGRLLLINNEADPSTGTVRLKAQFPNAQRTLWPGTFVNVHVVIDIRKGVTVPLTALQQGPAGSYVYVVSSDGIARMRPVTVGQSRDAQALIEAGLKAGEQVVTDGQYGLVDGAKVAVATNEIAARAIKSSTTASAGMLP
jgi:multidrug efflux system membrane fusion protein